MMMMMMMMGNSIDREARTPACTGTSIHHRLFNHYYNEAVSYSIGRHATNVMYTSSPGCAGIELKLAVSCPSKRYWLALFVTGATAVCSPRGTIK